MKRAVLIVNPVARGGAEGVAGEAAETLRRSGWEAATLCATAAGGSVALARDAIRDGDLSLLIAVGGDGTAREVAQGIAQARVAPPLLILPAGTGNSMHKELWGDLTWQSTLDAALHGAARRRIDLARIAGHDRAVLLGASAGFLRWAVEATAGFPELSGRELYATAGLAAAQELRPYHGRVTVDGRVLAEGPIALAAVGGARRRGGSLLLFPRSRLDDGLLDACVLSAGGPDDAIPLLMAAMEGTHLDMPGVHYAQGREVLMEALDGPLPFEHDGDLWPGDDAVLHLSVVPGAVPVLCAPAVP